MAEDNSSDKWYSAPAWFLYVKRVEFDLTNPSRMRREGTSEKVSETLKVEEEPSMVSYLNCMKQKPSVKDKTRSMSFIYILK